MSLNVIVMSDVPMLSATTEPEADAVMVELPEVAAPAMKATVVVAAIPAGAVIEKVLVSAVVDFTVNHATPEASDVRDAGVMVLLEPVLAKVTVPLGTRLLFASLSVIVTLDTEVPSATTVPDPVAAIVVVAEAGTPGPTTMPVVKQAVVRPCEVSVALRNIVSALV